MDNCIYERIRILIDYLGISDRQFAIKIGVNQSVIGSMFQKQTEPSAKVLKLILATYKDVSAEWLMRGTGNMLISENIDSDSNLDRINKLVDTITTLQDAINEKTKTIKVLEEEIKNLKRKQ